MGVNTVQQTLGNSNKISTIGHYIYKIKFGTIGYTIHKINITFTTRDGL